MSGKGLACLACAAWLCVAQAEGPKTPNPYLSFLPADAETDWQYWKNRARMEGRERRLRTESLQQAFPFGEAEPNDSRATANPIAGFGTGPGRDGAVDVLAGLSLPAPLALPVAEDDGSIPLATPTGLAGGDAVHVSAFIGDGPYGGTSGDYDFYLITGMRAGQTILADVDTADSLGGLDTWLAIWDSGGAQVAINNNGEDTLDSRILFEVEADGDYFVSVHGVGSFFPENPFDSASGMGAGSEGDYELTIALDYHDTDFFAVELRKGDILGANVLDSEGVTASLLDPAGTLRIGSDQDVSFVVPDASPLSGGGSAVLSYVIEMAGTYVLQVDLESPGEYTLEVRAFRAPLASGSPGDAQTLFLDFDGATIDALALFEQGHPLAVLSPLADFLAGWGLGAADEDAVIDAIVAAARESLSTDMRARGLNGDFDATGIPGEFDIQILNSRDHPDPFGQPNVSRVIIGGTVDELGILTLGIAEGIDPGNFVTGETAVVLLDLLGGPAGEPDSLGTFPREPGVSMIDLIGVGVGNIAAHEAGHFLGNYHTENQTTLPNIMDRGGNLPNIVGVGSDGIFGNADDIDVDFGVDEYVPSEGFVGVEDTLNTVAFGCPTPTASTVVVGGCDSGVPNLFLEDQTTLNESIGVCAMSSTTHGQFSSCVSDLLERARKSRLISGMESGAIKSCVAQSSIEFGDGSNSISGQLDP